MGRAPGGTSTRVFTPTHWMDDASCRQASAALFFPQQGRSGVGQMRRAKAVCSRCPVLAQCLEWAVADPSLHGILGGMSERERRAVRVSRRREAS